MRKKDNKAIYIVPIIILLAILIAYFYGWQIAAKIHPESTAYNISDLAVLVNEQLQDGKEKGVFYVTGIDEYEIESINDYLCSTYGTVSQYSILEKTKGGMKILLNYEISDNYYVVQKYKNGEEIPGSRPEAYKLYDKVVYIIDEIIEPGMTDYEKELAIHDYIVLNCEYVYTDYSKEYAYRAYGALVQGKAVCNGYAEAMALLLSCVDVENYIMTGEAGTEQDNRQLHAWNAVKLDGEWYQVDATWDDPIPDRGSFAGHMYFNVTDDIMDDTHSWDEDLYDDCDSTFYNYFEYNNLVTDYSGLDEIISATAAKNITGSVEVQITDYNEENYNLDFIFDIPGITHFQYSNDKYGDDHILTIYLNQSL